MVGSLLAARLGRRLGSARVLTGSLLLAALATLGVGLSSDPWVAGVLYAAHGLGVVLFNVVGGSLRQSLVPDHLLGRVISAFRLFSYGAAPLGALLGGAVARGFGLRAPFLLAGTVIPVAILLCLRVVNSRTVAEAHSAATGS